MTEQYIIKFSSDKITCDGKNICDEKNKQVADAFEKVKSSGGKQTKEDIEKLVTLRSKRDNEKEIIQTILQTAFKTATKPQDFKLIADIDATVEDAEESFLINIDEWKKHVQDQFENTIKNLAQRQYIKLQDGREADPFPYYWKHCREMLTQIYAPELFKKAQVGENKNG